MNIETLGDALKTVRNGSTVEAREVVRSSEQLRARAPDAVEQAAPAQGEPLDRETLEAKLGDLEERLAGNGVELKFRLREESGDLQVEVLDPESDKVVRKIPPDELIKLSASLEEQAGGFLNKAL